MATKRTIPDKDFGQIIIRTRITARNISMRTKPDGLHITVPPYSQTSKVLAAIEESSGQPAIAGLPPFNDADEQVWISVSPESTFAMSALDEGEAHNAARVLLYEFIWENYDIQQNAHGTIPVHTSYPQDKLVLPEPMIPVVGDMGAAPGIKMGFNLWTAEFKNIACTALNDVYSGNSTAEAAAALMSETLPTTFLNAG